MLGYPAWRLSPPFSGSFVVKVAHQKFGDVLVSHGVVIVKVVAALEKLYARMLYLPLDGFKVLRRGDTVAGTPGNKNWQLELW